MVPYRHQNKKAFIVARISLHRHTLCPTIIGLSCDANLTNRIG
jgi:hypothetical protein